MRYTREKTVPIKIKQLQIGHNNEVIIQSMTTTKTSDIDRTLRQINDLISAGCQIVRVAILDEADIKALPIIIKKVKCPLVADIHYNFHYAIDAIKAGIAKIRINPGTIGNLSDLKAIVECAKTDHTPIRIGFNEGSLPKDLIINENCTLKFKAKAIVKNIMKYIKLFESWNFYQIVVSFKSSNPSLTAITNDYLSRKCKYPLHIGVTEAGTYESAIIKSTLGLVPLLKDMKIGNTIRVSITGDPIKEISVAKKILNNIGLYPNMVTIISCPTCGRCCYNIEKLINEVEEITKNINFPLSIAIMGCSVNGFGEGKNADLGVIGGRKNGIIFANKKILKTVKSEELLSELKELINEKIKNK